MECWLYTRLYLGLIGAFQAMHSAPSDTQLAVCTRSARFSVFHRPFRPTVAIDEFSLSPKHQHDHRLTASLDTSPRGDKVHRVLACSETSARHPLGPLHGSIDEARPPSDRLIFCTPTPMPHSLNVTISDAPLNWLSMGAVISAPGTARRLAS